MVPQFVPRKWWHQLLHAQTAVLLRLALINRPGIVITNVPYQMAEDEDGPDAGGAGPTSNDVVSSMSGARECHTEQ